VDTIKPLFTATATASAANGHTESDDGMVKADLSVPKAMGRPGKPGTATPEHLFAAGYAACFGGALDYVASSTRGRRVGPGDLRRDDRAAGRGRVRPGSPDAGRGQEPAPGRVGALRRRRTRRSALLARHARQRLRGIRGRGGLSGGAPDTPAERASHFDRPTRRSKAAGRAREPGRLFPVGDHFPYSWRYRLPPGRRADLPHRLRRQFERSQTASWS